MFQAGSYQNKKLHKLTKNEHVIVECLSHFLTSRVMTRAIFCDLKNLII